MNLALTDKSFRKCRNINSQVPIHVQEYHWALSNIELNYHL